jgi:transposase
MSLFHVVRQSIKFYLNVMKRLREAVRRKRPEAWTNKTWMLHHKNAPALASLIREFLAKQEMIVVRQAPYSPDLAPADFFLFPKFKSNLTRRRFETVEEIKENSLQDLRAIQQNVPELEKNAGRGVSTAEGSTLKETSLFKL